MDEATRQRIQSVIDENEIVLFMKGSPQAPQCGFSATLVGVLEQLGVEFAHVNVLADANVRQGIKEFSDWPTIPQLYIHKEFVGGCDIVSEMFDSGELEAKVGKKLAEVPPPDVTVTAPAVAAFKDSLQGGDEFVRFEVSPRFEHALSIGPRQPKDVEVKAGELTLLLDRASAKRANGAKIDFVETENGPAFKIDNPNEPPKVRAISPKELKQKLDSGDRVEIIDVRSDRERAVASVAGAKALDRDSQEVLMQLPKDTPLVFLCHHGSRSHQAAEFFLAHGFSNVSNVIGGIDRWSLDVDPTVPRY